MRLSAVRSGQGHARSASNAVRLEVSIWVEQQKVRKVMFGQGAGHARSALSAVCLHISGVTWHVIK